MLYVALFGIIVAYMALDYVALLYVDVVFLWYVDGIKIVGYVDAWIAIL